MKKAFVIITIVCVYFCFSFLHSCEKENNTSPVSLRDRQEVYEENILEIEEYLQTNYLTIDAENNATAELIPEGGSQTSIWDTYKVANFNGTGIESVPYIEVKNDNRLDFTTDGGYDDPVTYKLYYIKLNEGDGVTPTKVDSTFTAYKGWNIDNEVFDQNNVGIWFSYPEPSLSAISGYRQILSESEVKTEATDGSGTTVNPDGTINHNGYGNIIVFIPSGLAYFSSFRDKISPYKPIIFQIKLFYRKERDHDGDQILSNIENLNNDTDFFNDDTDGDKKPNFLDQDDDGDGFLTRFEIIETDDGNGNYTYFTYDNIPTCSGGTLKKHLDPSCH